MNDENFFFIPLIFAILFLLIRLSDYSKRSLPPRIRYIGLFPLNTGDAR